ncbi:helix-turn-helix domain-containing protein [Salinispirillum marinum]|uniref:Helix-turn-helix domain-containing protein n=2 Tax=Saccharospirillaceae TaxID=255527 RepID=A0ABV8BGF0_9GAMM
MDRLTTLLRLSLPLITHDPAKAAGFLILDHHAKTIYWRQRARPDEQSLAILFQHPHAPLAYALTDNLRMSWAENPDLSALVGLLSTELNSSRCGGGMMLQHLTEVILIQLLRTVLEQQQAPDGLLAGLAHPQIARALVALHDHPEQGWTVERLADHAAMSRSSFIEHFRRVIGEPPGSYIAHWKLHTAQRLLNQGSSVAAAARHAGYSGPTALTRAYRQHFGCAPKHHKAQPVLA